MLKKILRLFFWIIGAFALFFLVIYLIYNEKEPTGTPGAEAEAMTQKMFAAVNKPAWDSLVWVKWTFRGAHHYTWDKQDGQVQILWDDVKVLMNTTDYQAQIWKNGVLLQGEAAEKLRKKAIFYFNNDSFWFCAPMKAADPGTERSVVKLADGRVGLKVHYQSGGSTPGDSYVWILDEQGMPTTFYLWVGILPINGLPATWENWVTLPGGAKLATFHFIAGLNKLPITAVSGGMDPIALN